MISPLRAVTSGGNPAFAVRQNVAITGSEDRYLLLDKERAVSNVENVSPSVNAGGRRRLTA